MHYATNIHNWSRQFKQEKRPFDVDEFLREVKELGMTGIEARFNNVFTTASSELKSKLREYGLQATAVGASVTAEPYAPNVEDYQTQIRAAVELEAPLLMVCGGFLANHRRNTYPADYDRFADSLGAAIEFAAQHGVTLAYHPHRGCIVETIAETRMMVDRLPELKLCIDTAHLAAAGEDAATFAETFADRIVHTHIKDYDASTLQFCEPGTGDSPLCDIRAVLEILRSAGYEGPLCLELDGGGEPQRPAKESARMSLEFMRG